MQPSPSSTTSAENLPASDNRYDLALELVTRCQTSIRVPLLLDIANLQSVIGVTKQEYEAAFARLKVLSPVTAMSGELEHIAGFFHGEPDRLSIAVALEALSRAFGGDYAFVPPESRKGLKGQAIQVLSVPSVAGEAEQREFSEISVKLPADRTTLVRTLKYIPFVKLSADKKSIDMSDENLDISRVVLFSHVALKSGGKEAAIEYVEFFSKMQTCYRSSSRLEGLLSMFTQAVYGLPASTDRAPSAIRDLIADLEIEERFIKRGIEINADARPLVLHEKLALPGSRKKFFTLSASGKVVVELLPGGNVAVIMTGNRARALSIQEFSVTEFPKAYGFIRAIERLEAGIGDFFTEDGCLLVGPKRKDASIAFDAVRRGVKIFPEAESGPASYEVEQAERAEQEREEHSREPFKPRHWGQEYLSSLNPIEVFPGQLFVTRAFWKLYRLRGDVIVAESDRINCGTYVGKGNAAKDLFCKNSRDDILEMHPRPEYFVGRVIHPEQDQTGRERWVKELHELLDRAGYDPAAAAILSETARK